MATINSTGYSTLSLKAFKKESIQTAKELCYTSEVIEKIEKAQSKGEVVRILHDARMYRTISDQIPKIRGDRRKEK